jgi:HNH endonuclease
LTTIHHLKPWAQGGRTDLENQVLLCFWHHRMVHEGGWRLARLETGELMLVRPPPELRSAA